MATVLVVDDEASIVEVVTYALGEAGLRTLSARTGPAALDAIAGEEPDLIILDVMLPGIDGFTLCRTIRSNSDVPIILLTARADEIDRIAGLELGADDYVVKPFGVGELVARVRANLRRSQGASSAAGPETDGPLVIDALAHRATWNGVPIELTRIQFDLLAFLAASPRQVFTREQLLTRVWDQLYTGDTRSVDSMVKRLRSRLRLAGAPDAVVESVRDLGYRFDPEALTDAAADLPAG